MLSSVDKMIQEYIKGRRELKKHAYQIDRDNRFEMNDIKKFESMTYSLEWMTTGWYPNTYRGINEKAVYQCRLYENIDLIPNI